MEKLENKKFMEQLVANTENALKEIGDEVFAEFYKRIMLILTKFITSEEKLSLLLVTFIKIRQGSEDFTEAEQDVAIEIIKTLFGEDFLEEEDITFEEIMEVIRS